MVSGTYFQVLGPLRVTVDGQDITPQGKLAQRVLTLLLLGPGRAVPISRLADGAWDEDPPATAAHQVRKTVADLRRVIPQGGELIVTEVGGYRIMLEGHDLDLIGFTAAVRRGKLALEAGHVNEGARELAAALALWRGPVLLGMGGRVIDEYGTELEELRLETAERLIDARLVLGEVGDLVGYIRRLVSEQPLREGLRLRLMQALCRAGRPSEALIEYQRARDLIAEELGADPGAPLRELHQAILTSSVGIPAAAVEVPAVPAPPALAVPQPTVLCTLPYDPPDFTGREAELGLLLSSRQPDSSGNPRIVAIEGLGGCGKTSLAVRAAHHLALSYPDGQLFVDLHGFTVNEPARSGSQVIAILLRQLQVPDDRIPVDSDDRAALWRMLIKDQRILLVLDNAADCAQVRPLLPASGTCMVIITSRTRLADLDGAELISLGPLTPAESLRLVERVLGADRVAAEPDAAERLCEACGGVPLALRITTARLRSRPNWSVRQLVDRLADETTRLSELAYGGRSIASTLQLSYQALSPEHREALMLLPLHPATKFDLPSAAALLGKGHRVSEEILEALVDVRLLDHVGSGRYALHDLVRIFVLSKQRDAATTERLSPEGGVTGSGDSALRRLLEYYEYTAARACALLFHTVPFPDTPAGPAGALPALHTAGEAAVWFDREWANLQAAVERSEQAGLFGHCVRLARYLSHFLNYRSRLIEYERAAVLAVSAARMTGDLAPLRMSLANLAAARWKVGRFRDGLLEAREALGVAERLKDQRGEAICLNLVGLFESCLGNLEAAHRHLRRAVSLHRCGGDPHQQIYALVNLSTLLIWLGHYEEAAATAAAAVQLGTRLGACGVRLSALNDLAIARLALGQEGWALDALADALSEGSSAQSPGILALSLALAAEAHQKLGDGRKAGDCIRKARDLLETGTLHVRQATVENILAAVHNLRGEHAEALVLFQSAYRHGNSIHHKIEATRALTGIDATMEALREKETGGNR